MDHRIRLGLHMDSHDKLSGQVEADETFIGGKARFMHKDRREKRRGGKGKAPGPEGKTIVAAVLERGGKVRATVVARRKKKDLHAFVKSNVEAGSKSVSFRSLYRKLCSSMYRKRWNGSDAERFSLAVAGIVGKRITFDQRELSASLHDSDLRSLERRS